MSSRKSHILTAAIFLFLVYWFSSCRTAREVSYVEAKPITTNKLLKRVEQNAFNYNDLTIRRINCEFSSDENRASFKVNLKASRDKIILVSISKLNIPVGRVLLTPDSVKYVNYIDRNYFTDDYSFLSKFLNIDLDFETIQAILSNNVFSYREDPRNRDVKTFDVLVESGMYLLQSEKNRKLNKIEGTGNSEKVGKKYRHPEDEVFILQKMYFNPATFSLVKLIIEDITNDRYMELVFGDFEQIEKKDYPGSIDMRFKSSLNEVKMNVKMNGFSTEKISSFSFTIPEKYEKIRVN